MSNTLAIAAVTAMLKDILENRLANHAVAISIGDLLVTALPPDRISVGSDERPQLNVFLYQVSQNRNADWIEHEHLEEQHREHKFYSDYRGEQPSLALDLHYLITAYGAKDFQAELLLGYAMQVLHDIPLITREMVYTALKHAAAMTTFGALSQVLATLSLDELADQVGTIKLCPEFFSMEETSKLWSSLQTHYRPSAGYQASMVLLSRTSAKTDLPATAPNIQQPTIERIESSHTGGIRAGDALILHGQRLQGTLTYLRINRSGLLNPETVQDKQITLRLPPDLPAGIQSIQVVHLNHSHGSPEEIQSNLAAFVVQPTLRVRVNSVKPLKSNLCHAELLLTVNPFITANQPSLLLLQSTSSDFSSVQINIPSSDTPTDTLTISIQVAAKRYWVQLQVDGVRSEAVEVEVGG
ncbi:MAG: DUF4255 domain-containing protein [Cyanobacteria bacterium RM1_2_2]|nr:DUF4255 domain-containing protein [Cyanobacteria bacterium RM1_2_2]